MIGSGEIIGVLMLLNLWAAFRIATRGADSGAYLSWILAGVFNIPACVFLLIKDLPMNLFSVAVITLLWVFCSPFLICRLIEKKAPIALHQTAAKYDPSASDAPPFNFSMRHRALTIDYTTKKIPLLGGGGPEICSPFVKINIHISSGFIAEIATREKTIIVGKYSIPGDLGRSISEVRNSLFTSEKASKRAENFLKNEEVRKLLDSLKNFKKLRFYPDRIETERIIKWHDDLKPQAMGKELESLARLAELAERPS